MKRSYDKFCVGNKVRGNFMTNKTKKSWFRKAIDKYDEFCKDLGVDQGACRSCVPVVKFDDEKEDTQKKVEKKDDT